MAAAGVQRPWWTVWLIVLGVLVTFSVVALLFSTQPLRVNTTNPGPPAAFRPADEWVAVHLGTSAKFLGSMNGPSGQTLLVWHIFPGRHFTVGGRTWTAPVGSLVGVTVHKHDPSYAGPVYLEQPGGSWVLVTAQQ